MRRSFVALALATALASLGISDALSAAPGLVTSVPPTPASAAGSVTERLVFGSFRSSENADGWARRVARLLNEPVVVDSVRAGQTIWFRVLTRPLTSSRQLELRALAENNGVSTWTLREFAEIDAGLLPDHVSSVRPVVVAPPDLAKSPPADPERPSSGSASERRSLSVDIGMQSRFYPDRGLDGQARLQPSVSGQLEFFSSWNQGRNALTVTPFLRIDARDDERTHADLREFYWSRIGNAWELHAGLKRVFWGVAEFRHLVDVINQTDLVENIDGEDKLGQPMIELSLVRDWGVVDLYLLPAFRERTFPGVDGRLRSALVVDEDAARYESGKEQYRLDSAVRWSNGFGPFVVGVSYFSGTSRDPLFEPVGSDGLPMLRPFYPVIDQWGLDAQAIFGPWAWKLESINRGGFGRRYLALAAGFERTLVGVLGGRSDMGLVAEFLYDERDEDAFDNIFEHDLALGTRWMLNDLADSQALFGVIWDVDTHEYIVKLEASRRLGDTWTMRAEGRIFGGAERLDLELNPASLGDPDNKTGALQRDDFLQLELTKFL